VIWFCRDGAPIDGSIATTGLQKSEHHAKRGRFPGTVRPQQSKDFTGDNAERDTINGDDVFPLGGGKSFADLANLNDGHEELQTDD
jgi:hypothetical protein